MENVKCCHEQITNEQDKKQQLQPECDLNQGGHY